MKTEEYTPLGQVKVYEDELGNACIELEQWNVKSCIRIRPSDAKKLIRDLVEYVDTSHARYVRAQVRRS